MKGVYRNATQQRSISPTTPHAQAGSPLGDSFSQAEKEELESWNTRLRPDMGVVQTPPAGKVEAKYEKAQGYILDLLDRIAGDELTKRNLELRVEVFSGDVPQAALDDNMNREKAWDREHPDQEWPVRGWMGVPSGSDKPIYRLGVNLGMLRTLETEDELAFVLAQQTEILLDHDKRDPNNEELLSPANQNFVDSREWQGAADRAAIARISKAGFNPKGALKALNTLYKKTPIDYPADDLERGLTAAAHGHEHEGMRIGMVQAEVESYVRRGEVTAAQDLTPLPGSLDIDAPAGYEKAVQNTAAYQRDYENLAMKLATDETPAWMFRDGVPPKEMGTIKLAGGTPEDKSAALLMAVEKLNQTSDRTPQQKVDGFLRLLVALRFETLPEEPFSKEILGTINEFLSKESANWDAGKFMNSLVRNRKTLQKSFISTVVFNENFQNMARNALPGLAASLPDAWVSNRSKGKVQPEDIQKLIERNHSDGRHDWALASRIDKASLNYVKGLDAQALAQEKSDYGASKAMVLSNDLLGMTEPTPEFQLQLREAGQDLVDASAVERENQARLRLRPPFAEPKQLYGYLNELGKSETWKSFSPEFQSELPSLLSDLATLTDSQPGMLYSELRPGALDENLEKRVAELATQADGQDAMKFLSRHIQHNRRVRGASPRRAWLGEAAKALAAQPDLVAQLETPDRSQHSALIAKTLVDGYNLKPEDLPDTGTASLKALNERVKAGEFAPKRENYTSDSAYDRAVQQYRKRQNDMDEVLSLVAPLESRLVLGKMALLGHNTEVSEAAAEKLDLNSFTRVLKGAEEAVDRAQTLTALTNNEDTEHVGADTGAFLMDGFLKVQDQVEKLEQWHDLASRSIDFSNGGLEARVGTKRRLADNLFGRLENLEAKELREWLGKDKVLEILNPAQASDLLVKVVGDQAAPGADLNQLAKTVEKLDQKYKLNEEHPVAYLEMRDKLTENAKLQPSNVDDVFPKIERGVTDTTAAYKEQARALSSVLAVARERSAQEQIDTIEYLMGRQDNMPPYLEEAAEAQSFAPLSQSLQTTRQDLLDADNQTRVMIANSFLAGPSGILRTEEGKQTVINHFLKNLHPDNRDLGQKIARGVLYSHGEADTLAVAYILGQKPEELKEGQEKGKLDEATILNRLFDAYGVPGIKMKQYLAFTAEFKDFKDAFENSQDAAMPLNYYQVLKLVQKRFGDEWPQDLKIDRVLGSGSVNVAIRYTDEKSGKREVVSLGREDIEETTRYDFDRFNKFIEELTRTPEDRETFGYVLGLMNLIKTSVELEFEKEQAMNVQKMAYGAYQHKIDGWTVRSIDAYKVENLGLFMQEAKGKTARKIYIRDKELYKDAMQAMAKAEFGILKGQDHKNNWWPKPLFANPDFHDGQVMISEEDKTVTILDFGQAVPIDNEDRKAGLDLLTIIGKADSPKRAAKRLNKRYFNKEDVLTAEDMAPIMEREDRMDCFIHLLSAISRKGAEVPLSTVHWVLGINRQMALGEKIGKPIDNEIRNIVITHKVKLPLGAYNTAHATKETAVKLGKAAAKAAVSVARSIATTIGGWFGWEKEVEDIFKSEPAQEQPRKSKYPAWRPDFGGTMPGARIEEAAKATE